jgi:hypothetical protein
MPFNDWDGVALAAESVFSTSAEPFSRETIENARDLLATCRCSSPVPDDVGRGYWSTLCLFWGEFKFELEVCSDHVEVYHLEKPQLQVWYEQHTPGQEFSSRFLAELPKASGEAGSA